MLFMPVCYNKQRHQVTHIFLQLLPHNQPPGPFERNPHVYPRAVVIEYASKFDVSKTIEHANN